MSRVSHAIDLALISRRQLRMAAASVWTKAGVAVGLDGLTKADVFGCGQESRRYQATINSLSRWKRSYCFSPTRRVTVEIRGKKRSISVMNFHDRIMAQALVQAVHENIPASGIDACRPGIDSRRSIVEAAVFLRMRSIRFAVRSDVRDAFGSLRWPSVLSTNAGRMLPDEIRSALTGIHRFYSPSGTGVPTGLATSPLLLNLAFSRLDEKVMRLGTYAARFMDDVLVLGEDAEIGDLLLDLAERELRPFGLRPNEQKTGLYSVVGPGTLQKRVRMEICRFPVSWLGHSIDSLGSIDISIEKANELWLRQDYGALRKTLGHFRLAEGGIRYQALLAHIGQAEQGKEDKQDAQEVDGGGHAGEDRQQDGQTDPQTRTGEDAEQDLEVLTDRYEEDGLNESDLGCDQDGQEAGINQEQDQEDDPGVVQKNKPQIQEERQEAEEQQKRIRDDLLRLTSWGARTLEKQVWQQPKGTKGKIGRGREGRLGNRELQGIPAKEHPSNAPDGGPTTRSPQKTTDVASGGDGRRGRGLHTPRPLRPSRKRIPFVDAPGDLLGFLLRAKNWSKSRPGTTAQLEARVLFRLPVKKVEQFGRAWEYWDRIKTVFSGSGYFLTPKIEKRLLKTALSVLMSAATLTETQAVFYLVADPLQQLIRRLERVPTRACRQALVAERKARTKRRGKKKLSLFGQLTTQLRL